MSLISVKNSFGSRKPLLCDVCRNISFDHLIEGQKMKHRIFKELPSTLSHCILCKLIFQTMKRLIIQSSVPDIEVSKYLEELGPSKLRLGFRLSEEGHGMIQIDVIPSIMIDGWLPFGGSQNTLRLFRQQGDPPIKGAAIPAGRFLEPTANSENLIKTISGWFDQCIHSHQMCQQPDEENVGKGLRRLPARVLDLRPPKGTSSNSPQLTEEFCGPYIALSHCWGKTRHIITEKNNIESHKKGIPVQHLPKTLQDAIVLTKGIGLRYLWIDSLCIIQDDINDWKNEAAKMADVYRNAYCTIAAAGSKDDEEGIFIKRSEQDVCVLRYNAANTYIAATYAEDDVAAMLELHKSPLSNRAWTLQERLLSQRTIHFTTSRVIWECQSKLETEDLLVLGPDDFGSILTQSLFEFSTTRSKWLLSIKAVRQEIMMSKSNKNQNSLGSFQTSDSALLSFSYLWSCLIQDYSRRGLTISSDKLIALSGLVQEAQEQTGLRYCAGIWLEMLHTELCWVIREGESATIAPTYRAPTWSWASIDGAVQSVIFETSMGSKAHQIRSEIELCHCNLSVGYDGQLTSAQLLLSGTLRPGRLTIASSIRKEFRIASSMEFGSLDAKGAGKLWLDGPFRSQKGADVEPINTVDSLRSMTEEDVAPQEAQEAEEEEKEQQSILYQFLHVSSRRWSEYDSYEKATKERTICEILVLKEVKEVGRVDEFVRVGAGYIHFNSWFESNGPVRQITIF